MDTSPEVHPPRHQQMHTFISDLRTLPSQIRPLGTIQNLQLPRVVRRMSHGSSSTARSQNHRIRICLKLTRLTLGCRSSALSLRISRPVSQFQGSNTLQVTHEWEVRNMSTITIILFQAHHHIHKLLIDTNAQPARRHSLVRVLSRYTPILTLEKSRSNASTRGVANTSAFGAT